MDANGGIVPDLDVVQTLRGLHCSDGLVGRLRPADKTSPIRTVPHIFRELGNRL